MIFKAKEKEHIRYGTTKMTKHFAWFPEKMSSEDIIWLQSYWKHQVWEKDIGGLRMRGVYWNYYYDGWRTFRKQAI